MLVRGLVVPLSAAQRVLRARYLAGLVHVSDLDVYVRKDNAPSFCPDLYYLLKDHNGGKDPTAPDPADRWTKEGSKFLNRTADCIVGAAWCGGFDRWQPKRFTLTGWDGWINTDAMLLDATGPQKCFRTLDRPLPGCFVVCASGSYEHKVGHIGTVVEVPAEWDATKRECWEAVKVVDVAARTPERANQVTTARGWWLANSKWVMSTMTP
jgi:hypothetical protein